MNNLTTHPPGSDKAIEAGCTCPILDNSNGKGWMGLKGIFVFSPDCPIHPTEPSACGNLPGGAAMSCHKNAVFVVCPYCLNRYAPDWDDIDGIDTEEKCKKCGETYILSHELAQLSQNYKTVKYYITIKKPEVKP